ncbi:hypothetical protein F5141DRAFT_1253308 [Pisolithus sp. B1]|nr:hypothetical protein F5141DRAFT_1253308 [Pisolithus sp. B1]
MEHAIAPTIFLPPLVHLDDYTPCQVLESLHMLKRLYFPHTLSSQPSSAGALSPQTRIIPEFGKMPARCVDVLLSRKNPRGNRSIECRGQRAFSHEHVPDSGYASVEEDSKSIVERDDSDAEEGDEVFLELLRADNLERGFAIKWLTGFLKRAHSWMIAQSMGCPMGNEGSDGGLEEGGGIEGDIFSELNEEASALLSCITSYGEEEDDSRNEIALTRQFCFLFNKHSQTAYTPLLGEYGQQNDDSRDADTTANQEFVVVELNDAPLDASSSPDESAHPSREPPHSAAMRVLELGAGTGLLSIVAAKLYRQLRCPAHVKATDYHLMVLENLIQNIRSNFNSDRRLSSVTNGMEGLEEVNVEVEKLDWSSPPEVEEEEKYDIVLAADVIYDPRHAHWICDCVMKTLKKPMPRIGGRSGVFWLAMPLRSTGRHEGMERTVEDAFPAVDGLEEERKGEHRLVIVSKEELGRQEGIGRADECGYTLFEIRWA